MTKVQVCWMGAVVGVVGVVVGGLGSSVAIAQEAGPLAGPLGGPGIEVREVPGVTGSFGTRDAGRFGAREQPVPLPIFLEAINSLSSEEVGHEVALSAEQLDFLRAEVRAFREELAAFAEASGEEVQALVGQLPQHERGRAIRELRKLERLGRILDRVEKSEGFLRAERRSLRERRGEELPRRPRLQAEQKDGFSLRFRGQPEGAPGTPGSMMEPMQEGMEAGDGPADARARLAVLQAAAPSPSALEIRLWEMLTEPQRKIVGAALEAYLAEVQARWEEQRLAQVITPKQDVTINSSADIRNPLDREFGRKAQGMRRGVQRDVMLQQALQALDMGRIPQQLWARLPTYLKQQLELLPENERAAALAQYLRSRQGDTDARPDLNRPG